MPTCALDSATTNPKRIARGMDYTSRPFEAKPGFSYNKGSGAQEDLIIGQTKHVKPTSVSWDLKAVLVISSAATQCSVGAYREKTDKQGTFLTEYLQVFGI